MANSFTAPTDGVTLISASHVTDLQNAIQTGWMPAGETWTYASATTFTVSGDVTAKYYAGVKLKLTQTSAKYFYVVGASYSAPNTTITVTGGTDYTLTNAAITSPYLSYSTTPQGFPQWFAYTPTLTGGNADLSGYDTARFSIVGRVCHVHFSANNRTLSGSAGRIRVTLPVASAVSRAFQLNTYVVADGSWVLVRSDIASNYVDIHKTLQFSNWNATETSVYIEINGSYEI